MPPLPAGLPAGGLPLGLRVRNAYRVPGGRDTAVGAGLRNGFGSALKFRDPGFEFLYLLVPADKIAVQDIDDKGLRVKFLRELRGVEILGEPHFPKEQLASSGEFHPVRLDALSQSRVEVLFHAAKVRKRFDICKYNILSDSVLNVVSGLSGRVGAPSRGEPNERFLSASAEPAEGCRRQIFGGREHDLAA